MVSLTSLLPKGIAMKAIYPGCNSMERKERFDFHGLDTDSLVCLLQVIFLWLNCKDTPSTITVCQHHPPTTKLDNFTPSTIKTRQLHPLCQIPLKNWKETSEMTIITLLMLKMGFVLMRFIPLRPSTHSLLSSVQSTMREREAT